MYSVSKNKHLIKCSKASSPCWIRSRRCVCARGADGGSLLPVQVHRRGRRLLNQRRCKLRSSCFWEKSSWPAILWLRCSDTEQYLGQRNQPGDVVRSRRNPTWAGLALRAITLRVSPWTGAARHPACTAAQREHYEQVQSTQPSVRQKLWANFSRGVRVPWATMGSLMLHD